MALTLGGVLFTGFEIPDQINVGGGHALHTHKLPGGGRVIDAMGQDDDPISWQGRFRGGLAAFRARALDAVRVAGNPVTLAWDAFRFTGGGEPSSRPTSSRAYEIPYTIILPRRDQHRPPRALPGLADLLGSDLE